VHVAAAAQDFFNHPLRETRPFLDRRRGGDDAVEGRLHRAGGDAERLQIVGAQAEGDDDGHEHDLDVFLKPVERFFVRQGVFANRAELFRGLVDLGLVRRLDRGLQVRAARLDLRDALGLEQVAFVIQEFFRALEQFLGFFLPLRREHGGSLEADGPDCKRGRARYFPPAMWLSRRWLNSSAML
jgi:hypothetical protein